MVLADSRRRQRSHRPRSKLLSRLSPTAGNLASIDCLPLPRQTDRSSPIQKQSASYANGRAPRARGRPSDGVRAPDFRNGSRAASRLTGRRPAQATETWPTRRVATQRQTYEPFTNTRTQAVPAAAAPTAAPPTTARRVCRRATPATLTGVNGRPTLACALSIDSERPLSGDHVTDPRVPNRKPRQPKTPV